MALPTASDNPFPSILITEGTEPSAPAAGKQRLYIDSTTHKLKRTDSSGTDVTIEGIANPMTTAGDVIYGGASGVPTRLATGTAGKILRVNSGATAPEWDARHHGCKVYNDGTQSISNNSSTAITFGAEEYDTDAFHDTGSNTSRITIPSGLAGKYRLDYHVMFASSNTTGIRLAFLRKNGGGTDNNNVIASRTDNPPSASQQSTCAFSVTVDLAVGDYVELFVYQNSGSAINVGIALASGRGDVSMLACEFLG